MKVKVTKEVEACILIADLGVRCFKEQNAKVNGEWDVYGKLIPCKEEGRWLLNISLETGKILNWPEGVTAEVHYKVCDDGIYTLLGEHEEVIIQVSDSYVPDILDPSGYGYSDYIILEINEEGFIKGWNNKKGLSEFEEQD